MSLGAQYFQLPLDYLYELFSLWYLDFYVNILLIFLNSSRRTKLLYLLIKILLSCGITLYLYAPIFLITYGVMLSWLFPFNTLPTGCIVSFTIFSSIGLVTSLGFISSYESLLIFNISCRIFIVVLSFHRSYFLNQISPFILKYYYLWKARVYTNFDNQSYKIPLSFPLSILVQY